MSIKNNDSVYQMADQTFNKYRTQVEAFEKYHSKRRINESVDPHEIAALGRTLDQYTQYQRFIQESYGSIGNLGAVPMVALDVITAVAGSSILPLVASSQPISEEHGVVYYREIRAGQKGGGYEEGEVIRSPLGRDNPGDGTAYNQYRQQEVIGTGNGTDTDFAHVAPNLPLRPYTIEFNIPGVGSGKDDGNGHILGFGFDGTINYATGEIKISTKNPLAQDANIEVRYDVDVDRADGLPTIVPVNKSKEIRASIIALASDIGTFNNFAFQQRFGRSNADQTAEDLTTEMVSVLNTRAIKMLNKMAKGNTVWNQQPPAGVSYYEHKRTFVDVIAKAESVLHFQSGASLASRYVAGLKAAAVIRGLPGFVGMANDSTASIALIGFLNDIPVIRATGVVPDDELLLIANPDNYFTAPLAYSTYMPIMLTDTVQSPSNPFQGRKAIGHWAGLTELVDTLVTRITIKSYNFGG